MKALTLLEKVIKQVEPEFCQEDCDDCSQAIGCAILEAKQYLADELGIEEDYE